ncbi:MAG: transketolase C-terminal domain-containing protein, partial [Gemmatimonadales bacterium]
LEGPADAQVTLVGWGSTWGVISESVERLNREGISANHLQVRFLVPFHGKVIGEALGKSRKVIVVENSQSGQFARHLRAETGITAHGHIRKYDGEPFEPKHIVAAVKQILKGEHVVDVLSTEPGWRTEHPAVVQPIVERDAVVKPESRLHGSGAAVPSRAVNRSPD